LTVAIVQGAKQTKRGKGAAVPHWPRHGACSVAMEVCPWDRERGLSFSGDVTSFLGCSLLFRFLLYWLTPGYEQSRKRLWNRMISSLPAVLEIALCTTSLWQ